MSEKIILKNKNDQNNNIFNANLNNMASSSLDNQARLELVEKMLTIAGKHGGHIFGGFVRDLVVPMLYKIEDRPLSWSDIDIWFIKQTDRDNFVAEMGSVLIEKKVEKVFDSVDTAQFRINYLHSLLKFDYVENGQLISKIDLVFSDHFPAFDVNICYLIYKYVDSKPEIVKLSRSKIKGFRGICGVLEQRNHQEMVESIKTKQVKLTYEYCQRILCLKEKSNQEYFLERIVTKYIDRGWTVITPNGINLNLILDHYKDLIEEISQLEVSKKFIRELILMIIDQDLKLDKICSELYSKFRKENGLAFWKQKDWDS